MEDWSDERLLTETPTTPAAFGVFYRRHERAIFAYFMRRTGDPEIAADLAAETFAAALTSAGRFRPGCGAGGWRGCSGSLGTSSCAASRSTGSRTGRGGSSGRAPLEPRRRPGSSGWRGPGAGRPRGGAARTAPRRAGGGGPRARHRRGGLRRDRDPAALPISESVVRQRVSRGLLTLRGLAKGLPMSTLPGSRGGARGGRAPALRAPAPRACPGARSSPAVAAAAAVGGDR